MIVVAITIGRGAMWIGELVRSAKGGIQSSLEKILIMSAITWPRPRKPMRFWPLSCQAQHAALNPDQQGGTPTRLIRMSDHHQDGLDAHACDPGCSDLQPADRLARLARRAASPMIFPGAGLRRSAAARYDCLLAESRRAMFPVKLELLAVSDCYCDIRRSTRGRQSPGYAPTALPN